MDSKVFNVELNMYRHCMIYDQANTHRSSDTLCLKYPRPWQSTDPTSVIQSIFIAFKQAVENDPSTEKNIFSDNAVELISRAQSEKILLTRRSNNSLADADLQTHFILFSGAASSASMRSKTFAVHGKVSEQFPTEEPSERSKNFQFFQKKPDTKHPQLFSLDLPIQQNAAILSLEAVHSVFSRSSSATHHIYHLSNGSNEFAFICDNLHHAISFKSITASAEKPSYNLSYMLGRIPKDAPYPQRISLKTL